MSTDYSPQLTSTSSDRRRIEMALKKCDDCDHEISRRAKNCPNCGAPQGPKQYSLGKLILFLLLGGFLYALIGGTSQHETKRQEPRRSFENVSSKSYPGTWPFYVKKGIFYCDERGAITFKADGKVYGINGTAKTDGFAPPDEIWKLDPNYEEKVALYAEASNKSLKEVREKMGPTRVSIQPVLDAGLRICRK